jgi:hypothetical protein
MHSEGSPLTNASAAARILSTANPEREFARLAAIHAD